ncbi:hypothetical protein B0H16DRAFT_1469513 [Mycena metata]|uniref:Uncharacterized protein n=1 Tax=Mycena metata TaxID=1033252 RepID=A0AAD7MRZ8_9AGAR|nr:hypothetical protein B0H16DRAFT_1469513 [Mycena metata]
MSLSMLQRRALRSWRIFNIWNSESPEPLHQHTISLGEGVRQFLPIPWTRLLVVVAQTNIHLRDWGTHASSVVVVLQAKELAFVIVRHYWVESIERDVLIVALTTKLNGGIESTTKLQFFAIDPDKLSTTHLKTITMLYSTTHLALMSSHLALVGHTASGVNYIHSFEVSYLPTLSVIARATLHIASQQSLSTSSFTILDDRHFLLASQITLAIYKLSRRAVSPGGSPGPPKPRNPSWMRYYNHYEFLSPPAISPVSISSVTSCRRISVCCGSSLRSVSMSSDTRPRVQLSRWPLIDPIPVSLVVSTGVRAGVYCRPQSAQLFCSSHTFTTFRMDNFTDQHPFATGPWPETRDSKLRGSFMYESESPSQLKSLHMDEGEGRIMFMLRPSWPEDSATAVVLELA